MIGVFLSMAGVAGAFYSLIIENDKKLIVSLVILGLGVACGLVEFGIDVPMRAW